MDNETLLPWIVNFASKSPVVVHNLDKRGEWCFYTLSACEDAPAKNYMRIGKSYFKLSRNQRLADLEKDFLSENIEHIKKNLTDFMPNVAKYEAARKEIEDNETVNYGISLVFPDGHSKKVQKSFDGEIFSSISPMLAVLLNLSKVAQQLMEDKRLEDARITRVTRTETKRGSKKLESQLREDRKQFMPALEEVLDFDTMPLPIFPKACENKSIFAFGGTNPVRVWELVPSVSSNVEIDAAGQKYSLKPYINFDACAENYKDLIKETLNSRLSVIDEILNSRMHMNLVIEAVEEKQHIPKDTSERGYLIENGVFYLCKLIKPIIIQTRDGYFIPLPQKRFADRVHRVDENVKQDILFGFHIKKTSSGVKNGEPKILNCSPNEYVFPGEFPNSRLCLGDSLAKVYENIPPLDLLRLCQNQLQIGYNTDSGLVHHLSEFEAVTNEKKDRLVASKKYILSEVVCDIIRGGANNA